MRYSGKLSFIQFSFLSVLFSGSAMLAAGAVQAQETSAAAVDITDAIFQQTSGDCADYAAAMKGNVTDIQRGSQFEEAVRITAQAHSCTLVSNNIPNHDFNDNSARFVTPVAEIAQELSIPRNPELSASKEALSQRSYDAVMLNGVVLDILSAGCYRPDGRRVDANGNVAIGCRAGDPWLLDPLGPDAGFGADQHNAHTQPNGLYHYHGDPMAMFDSNPGPDGSPVIGFAADGFPIFGSYFKDETGNVRKAKSGYQLKLGERPSSANDPGGTYDGMYVDDWEFSDAGDLDTCNGMTVGGQYGYYVTDTYPWVIACLSGKSDPSFRKRRN